MIGPHRTACPLTFWCRSAARDAAAWSVPNLRPYGQVTHFTWYSP
jgi:hypothetical protein